VTGGVVVRDSTLPEWQGIYLYGDYCSGTIWGLIKTDQAGWNPKALFETSANISSFGRDSSERVYYLDLGGAIFRLEAKP
jgi:hypothetical protein